MSYSKLLDWYEDNVRPFLEQHAKDRLPILDNDRDRLRRLLGRSDNITVCFIGNSGIGKSTLLNSLAAGSSQILPAGGIGPLTAQATEVHFSEVPCFTVHYHGRNKLHQVAFALLQRIKRDSKATANAGAEEEILSGLDEQDRREIVAEIQMPDVESGEEAAIDPVEAYIKQAKVIISGDQFSDKPLEYLYDAIAIATGMKTRWDSHLDAEDHRRVERIKKVFELAKARKAHTQEQKESKREFLTELDIHAAGFLSPLVQNITVGWNSALLREGVILVDLPGVGIAQDAYREITKKYVREKARAVVLVIDRAGPTDATIDLLRTSGYWDRLVGAADDPSADPCQMLIAVTRVDDVTDEEWAKLPKEDRPRKREVFEALVGKFESRIRGQIKEQLARITSNENKVVEGAREAAALNLLANLQIHPVSAPEYRRILADDEDDRSFLLTGEATGVPALANGLRQLCQDERESRRQALEEVSGRLLRVASTDLELIKSRWERGDSATAEAEKLREKLEEFLKDRRKEYAGRQGAFREFLEATVRTRIRELVLEAQQVAEEEVNKYLRRLQNEHWATLRAAVRRNGVWLAGRSRPINLPDDIAGYFQEPMAAVWSQRLLKDIRKRTTDLAEDIEAMVGEICEWANKEGGTSVNKKVLERQQSTISDRVEQLRQVGKEAVQDLRDLVKQKLMEVVKKPAKLVCEDFVKRGDDIGPGVKYRILALFSDLARDATKAAEKPAINVLAVNFEKVREEIRVAFEEWGDPIDDTADLVVERHAERGKRSDAQRRRKVLEEADAIVTTRPPLLEGGAVVTSQLQ